MAEASSNEMSQKNALGDHENDQLCVGCDVTEEDGQTRTIGRQGTSKEGEEGHFAEVENDQGLGNEG